jgi:copper chaperone CopZ
MKQDSEAFHPVGNAIFSLHTLEPPLWSRLERKLKKVPGITDVNLNYAVDAVQVRFDPTKVTGKDIEVIVKKFGNAPALGH